MVCKIYSFFHLNRIRDLCPVRQDVDFFPLQLQFYLYYYTLNRPWCHPIFNLYITVLLKYRNRPIYKKRPISGTPGPLSESSCITALFTTKRHFSRFISVFRKLFFNYRICNLRFVVFYHIIPSRKEAYRYVMPVHIQKFQVLQGRNHI